MDSLPPEAVVTAMSIEGGHFLLQFIAFFDRPFQFAIIMYAVEGPTSPDLQIHPLIIKLTSFLAEN